jgi:deoxycytidylate deaminase
MASTTATQPSEEGLFDKTPPNNDKTEESRNSIELIKDTYTPEAVFVLCGPIGSSLSIVSSELKQILERDFNYDSCEEIKLSKFILEHQDKLDGPKFNRADDIYKDKSEKFVDIQEKIEIGNALRKKYESSILAELAIGKIAFDRGQDTEKNGGADNGAFRKRRVAYIIDSIKNIDELNILRLVYRDMLYFIGVYSPLEYRIKILEGEGQDKNKKMTKSEIYELIDKDSGEEKPYGQKVSETFPLADFFLRVDSPDHENIRKKLKRFLNLVFGTKIVTPTPGETAMYIAVSSSGNSACLSRQVGAAITDKDGEIIAVGWNDVPKFGGNLYQEGNTPDNRCMHMHGGKCYNDEEKNNIASTIVETLKDKGLLKDGINIETTVDVVRDSKISRLVEFSRSIHAEMHAIIIGCQTSGSKIIGGKLYCTTYPCHNCARHIIVAGIKEVYYIEPYRKSLTIALHFDSITESEEDSNKKVKISIFDGVGPNRYLELFKMEKDSRKIKKSGKMTVGHHKSSLPKGTISIQAIPVLEAAVTKELVNKNVIKAK